MTNKERKNGKKLHTLHLTILNKETIMIKDVKKIYSYFLNVKLHKLRYKIVTPMTYCLNENANGSKFIIETFFISQRKGSIAVILNDTITHFAIRL